MMARSESLSLFLDRKWVPHGAQIVATRLRQLSGSTSTLTVLPPPDVLYHKLHEAIERARARKEANARDGERKGTA